MLLRRVRQTSCGFNFGWNPHICKITHPHLRLPALQRYKDAIEKSICFAASTRVRLIAWRPKIKRIFPQHPTGTKKIIARQIDHAFAKHDGLGRHILKECPLNFVPNTLARTPICQAAM
ncbi:MAG: hypothetical protein WBZ19_28735 [Chthoniobacterales bacterium]